MKLKKLLALALVGGMVAASLTTADAAKKKKKKKAKLVSQTSTFFLRNPAECDPEALTLSLTDAEDTDCYDPFNAAGSLAGYTDVVYNAADGVPFKLDAKKPLTGTITMRNGNGAGAGEAGVTLTFTGETGGEETEIATWESEIFAIIPQGSQTLEYEAEIDAALNKKKFTSLKLTVTPTGTTVGFYGTVEHDGPPPSLVNVPILVKKKK